jgi:hypothetical protein
VDDPSEAARAAKGEQEEGAVGPLNRPREPFYGADLKSVGLKKGWLDGSEDANRGIHCIPTGTLSNAIQPSFNRETLTVVSSD